jgi:hypothetical protein
MNIVLKPKPARELIEFYFSKIDWHGYDEDEQAKQLFNDWLDDNTAYELYYNGKIGNYRLRLVMFEAEDKRDLYQNSSLENWARNEYYGTDGYGQPQTFYAYINEEIQDNVRAKCRAALPDYFYELHEDECNEAINEWVLHTEDAVIFSNCFDD